MVSQPITLSCKINVDDDFRLDVEKYEMFLKECTWTRMSDDSVCRLTIINNDIVPGIEETKCDTSIAKATIVQGADKLRCSIKFDSVEGKAPRIERWKCMLRASLYIKDKRRTSKIAKDCVDKVIVNATVCTGSIYRHSYFNSYLYTFMNCTITIFITFRYSLYFRLCHTLQD